MELSKENGRNPGPKDKQGKKNKKIKKRSYDVFMNIYKIVCIPSSLSSDAPFFPFMNEDFLSNPFQVVV